MGKVLYFDCAAGVAGDMVLGALIDAGFPLETLQEAIGSLLLPGWQLDAGPVTRAGVGACKFRLVEPRGAEGHAPAHGHHDDDHHHHHHRTVTEICALVNASAMSAPAKARTCELFRKLAEVEAGIHRMPVEQVHLHEIGALDSIVDIAGAVVAFEWFAAGTVCASPLNVGGGVVDSEHGRLPVPAPATAALLRGMPVYSSGRDGELVTPTGALLIGSFATCFGPLPPMTVERVGSGAGDRDMPGVPNVLRVFVGRTGETTAGDRVLVMTCEIDDMSPQLGGALMESLYAAGALEVYFTAVQMKKNRPGFLVTVLALPARRESLAAIVFRETTTIGLRYQEVERLCLAREVREVATRLGPVRVKIARMGGDLVNAAPEFEECHRLAREHGIPLKEVQAIVMEAFRGH